MIEVRTLIRTGRCSGCYKKILREEEIVCTVESPKHRKLIILCKSCINKIKERSNGRI